MHIRPGLIRSRAGRDELPFIRIHDGDLAKRIMQPLADGPVYGIMLVGWGLYGGTEHVRQWPIHANAWER